MKKISPALSTVFLFAVFYMQVYSICGQSVNNYSNKTEARITQVEHNLSGWVQIEDEPKWTLEGRMKFYHCNGVSIAVIKDYKIEWAKGYGWADSAEQRPVTTLTLFQAGSNSKSLNAVGVLKLAQDKKLDLYTDINDYLKSWKFPYDSLSKGKKITIANLLSHTAGLKVHGFPGYEKGGSVPTLIQVLNGSRPANTGAVRSMYAPSLKEEYSGGGTTISQLIVQDVTGQPYDKYMWENILKPLGMTLSSYTQPPSAEKETYLATGYYNDGKPVKGKYHIYPEQAAAGLWTNATDLAKYVIETELALQGKSQKVLSKEMTALRLTPYIDTSAAFGVFIINKKGTKYFTHGGVDEGFVSQYVGSFEGGNGVVVMTNTYNTALFDEIINSVAATYNWKDYYTPVIKKIIEVSDTVLESYTGKYVISSTVVQNITRNGNQLYSQATNRDKYAIYPETPSKFFFKEFATVIEFIKDANGKVDKYVVYQNGKPVERKRAE